MTPPSRSSAGSEPAAAFISRAIAWILVGCGLAGLAAAFALTLDKIRLLEDPGYVPACTIDAVLTCGTVMTSDQAEAFGFPNPIIGLVGFSAVLTLAIALVAGATLPRGIWLAIQAGLTFAVLFVHWLFFQSVYEIRALCPYCMVVWVASIVGFVYVTLHNLASGNIPAPRRLERPAAFCVRYHAVILTAWIGALTILIGEAFWDHWRSLV